jgi:phosphoribosylanthranilate isomerase
VPPAPPALPEVPKIKFCGITRPEDADAAVAAGAWAIGMILWSGSKRRCRTAVAARIAADHRRAVELVGVFVNPTLDQVTRAADEIGLTMVQLHGDEGPAFCAEAARRTGCRVIKAARVRSGADIQALGTFHTDFHLLDSYVDGMRGGTGETFSWELVRAHGRMVPVVLSGGLAPGNVAEAIAAVHPFAVDVASGVEAAPGIKDDAKLRAFAEAVAATATVTETVTEPARGAETTATEPAREPEPEPASDASAEAA